MNLESSYIHMDIYVHALCKRIVSVYERIKQITYSLRVHSGDDDIP